MDTVRGKVNCIRNNNYKKQSKKRRYFMPAFFNSIRPMVASSISLKIELVSDYNHTRHVSCSPFQRELNNSSKTMNGTRHLRGGCHYRIDYKSSTKAVLFA